MNTTAHRRPRLARTVGLLAAAALAGATLGGCGSEEPTEAADPGSTTSAPPTPPTSATTETAAEDASESATGSGTDTGTDGGTGDGAGSGSAFVTPFYVGTTPQGPRLFRELHRQVDADQALTLLGGAPADPDYRTLLPRGSLAGGYTVEGSGRSTVYGVELADAKWTERPAGMSARDARLAVQQVVWTLQTVQAGGAYDPARRTAGTVDFLLDGEKVDLLGVPSGVAAMPELRVLAMVNVISGLDQGPLTDGGATVEGMASSFEATVPWKVLRGDGEVVTESFSTAEGWMDGLYPFKAVLKLADLPPGEYTFVASTDDPSGGEGFGPTEDTKEFTVE